MGVHGVMDLSAASGQMSVIADGTAVVGEVITQTFGVIDVGVLTLLAFLICSEHLFWMLALSFAYKTDIQEGGFLSSRRGVFKLQNCLVAFWHVLKWYSEISTALVSSCIMHYAQISCWEVSMSYCQIKHFIYSKLLCTILYGYTSK